MIALDVKQLTKIYPNNHIALKGIDLQVKQGDFFALLGQNGAGKSTTLSIISSLVMKTSGTVSVFGHSIDTDLQNAKASLGIVPQEMNFNPFEKVSQIMINQAGYYGIPPKEAKRNTEECLSRMSLSDKYHTTAMRLSGGMKRRLMIARALVNRPKLLILDEPTAGVDIELRHMLWDFLTELNNKGTTIILTTHYLEEAEHLCKNVAIIDHGEIIEHTEMKSLINRLDTQTIIIDLQQSVTSIPEIPNYQPTLIDSTTLELKVNRQQPLNQLFAELSTLGIQVNSMRNKTNRLEELFLNLVRDNNKGH